MSDDTPRDRRRQRACLLCGLIKSTSQFQNDGCDNCYVWVKTDVSYFEYTSAKFDGAIAMLEPDSSWVARWQRIDKFCSGIYAIRVSGRISKNLEDRLADEGFKYRPRDGSAQE
ncbi:Spt4/RpoE2 zinc finger-domain-containing protein [Polychytrium aggregatum]|uniref:Spt4/RpoE2 zinc finger-domain-containing protein n=1 Tax=Polychytrium aggregatum TaxID=110093 RepID=UPI0022FEF4E8|nr:Spt4/RpoE2 zinc finger-domain-containing protein [Polychytrium aggregatum]KAI9190699.1 Spt4/RpoE2 zinc finger-domain-containing protein [Polychytrium aggregatum]